MGGGGWWGASNGVGRGQQELRVREGRWWGEGRAHPASCAFVTPCTTSLASAALKALELLWQIHMHACPPGDPTHPPSTHKPTNKKTNKQTDMNNRMEVTRQEKIPHTSKKSVAASAQARCCMCILPPHSRMTPMMRGWGMADLMVRAFCRRRRSRESGKEVSSESEAGGLAGWQAGEERYRRLAFPAAWLA